MKKTLSLLTILFIVASCLVIASAQTRRKRNTNINRGAASTRGQQRSAIGAGGAELMLVIAAVVTSPATANAFGFRKAAQPSEIAVAFLKESKKRT